MEANRNAAEIEARRTGPGKNNNDIIEQVEENHELLTDQGSYGKADWRRRRVLQFAVEIIVGGIAYFVITRLTGLYIPCPFRLITGYKCPGCGITRMILYLVEGNIYGAFEANQFVFLLLPGILLYGCCRAGKYIKSGEEGFSFAETVVLGVVLLGALIFGIIRNY